MTLNAGDRLGSYEIRELIGEGAMGRVYRALDARLQRQVAVKVLPDALARDADAVARFEREARAVAALSHPNVVQIHDFGTEGERVWAVTELLEGETLRSAMQTRRLTLAEALGVARQIAAGVAAAHHKGIVHRDLKPENIFVSGSGASLHVKVLDFGLAKRSADVTSATEDATLAGATVPGTVMGTVGYMSPEQVRGQEADSRSDVFALGAIFYELLAGRRAFDGPSSVEAMSSILSTEPSMAGLPAQVVPIVARCLAKDPAARFATAAEVEASLAALGAEASWQAEAGASVPAFAAAAPTPGSAYGSSSVSSQRDEEKSIAVLPFANLSSDPDTEYFSDGVTDEILSALTQIPGLRVAARTSSFYFKGRNEDLETVGEKLHVRSVLEGSVRRAGNRIRITAQLVNVADGYHLWSERFDRDLDDVFAVQDEIAAAIAERLKVSLSGGAGSAGGAPPTARAAALDPPTHELFLRARFLQDQRLLAAARDLFETVVARAPDFVPAHVGIAQCWAFDGLMMMRPPREAMVLAKEAAQRTLSIDPASAGAQAVLGMVSFLFDWDAAAAEKAFVDALSRDGSQTLGRCYYAFFLAGAAGRFEEALAQVEQAVALDPLNEGARTYEGMIHYLMGDAAGAVRLLSDTTKVQQNSYLGQRLLGLARGELGDLDGATAAIEHCLALSQRHRWGVVDLALIRLEQGREEEALRLREEAAGWSERGGHSCQLAIIPYRLGDLDAALQIVEKAIADRDGVLALVNHWPQFRGLRDEPRFRELYRQVGY